MNCKELIDELRFLSGHVPEQMCDNNGENALDRAATAIETLLAEREAAMKYIPHNCQTCKWWKERAQGITCCMLPEGSGFCCFDEPDLWQWRGPTPPDRQKTEN